MTASYRQLLDAGQSSKQAQQATKFAEDEDDSNFEDQPETDKRQEKPSLRAGGLQE